jgi:DNA-binding LacI/PurR family transcriptional regulator
MTYPTIRDVARKAGVGVGTVSRVINNNPRVSQETQARVMDAIQELGFRPNHIARQLPRKTRLRSIGVITQAFVNYYSFADRLRGVQKALYRAPANFELTLYHASSLENYEERLASIVSASPVEGLLVVDLDLPEEYRSMLTMAGIPFIGINHFQGADWPCIGGDNVEGGTLATEYLIRLGHRRIAYVGDEFLDYYGFITSSERFEGYKRAMEAAGLEIDDQCVMLGEFGYEAARQNMLHLLASPQGPTAVFAMTDIQALGCIAAIRESGLRVPEDVSVIGYDDLDLAYHTGLTTVRQHLELSGQLGLEYLLRLISADARASLPVPRLPPLEVVPRQTTCAPR